MKKSATLILLLCLILSQTGVWVSKHFCGGVEKGVSLYVDAPSCCPMEEPGEADGCCKNENKVYVEDFSFVSHEVSSETQPLFSVITLPVLSVLEFYTVSQNAVSWEISPPPDIIKKHNILFSQFLI